MFNNWYEIDGVCENDYYNDTGASYLTHATSSLSCTVYDEEGDEVANDYTDSEFEKISLLLTSYFITKLINRLSRFGMDDYLNLLFYNSHQYFDGVGESEIAGGIKAWLDHYSISSGRYRTLFIVEEDLESDLFKQAN